MIQESDLCPGDIFVTATYGNAFDHFIGSSIRFFTATKDEYGRWQNAKVNHTGLYIGNGKIIEAAPGGARIADWDSYGDNAIWSVNGLRSLRDDGVPGELINLTDAQRRQVVSSAAKLIGTPYGFLDIAAIAFAQARTRYIVDPTKPLDEQPWWVQKIEDRHTLICSQLVDLSFRNSNIHLFEDGRIPGLVSPNNIYGLFV